MRRRYFERTVVSSLGAGDSLTRAADLGPRASALGCLALTVAALHRPRTGEVERAERPVTHQASFSVTGTHQTARCRGGPTGTTLGKPCGPMGGGDDEIGGCGERQLAMAVPARRSTTTTIGVGAWAIATSVPALRSQSCATTPPRRSQDRSHSGPEGVTLAVPRSSSVGADAVMANDRLGASKGARTRALSAAVAPRRACLPVDTAGSNRSLWKATDGLAPRDERSQDRTDSGPIPPAMCPWPPNSARRSTMGRIVTTPARSSRAKSTL